MNEKKNIPMAQDTSFDVSWAFVVALVVVVV